MVQSLRTCALAGVAVVGTALIGLTPSATPDIQLAAPHSSVDVALTSSVNWLGVDFDGLFSGDQDFELAIDSIAPYVDRFTDQIVDTFNWLYRSSDSIDSVLGWLGLTGAGDWISAEHGLVQSALVADGFDPSAFDSSALFSPELTFSFELGWASWLLGLNGDHSSQLNELLGMGSQLMTGSLNLLVVALGTINPLLADLGPDTDLTELTTVLQSLYADYSSQSEAIIDGMLPILQDLGFQDLLGFDFG